MPQPACQLAKEELVACLLRTDCVLKSGKTPQECLQKPQELPLQCQHLITRFTDCKKGMLDMRRRFRGNHLSEEAKERARGTGAVDIRPADDIAPDRPNDQSNRQY
ncbi:hypothetical protein J008_02406 [Cryptococcus neoformans]|nr:hypothetical protein C367_02337 [Cryptococcus neoformans var. grubii Ze90-1]OXH35147.1 hypothetical protein J008_02406 [Cryptococcus neoformans var. grubii]